MLQDSPLQTVSFFRGPLVVVRNKTLIWGWLLGGPLKPSFLQEAVQVVGLTLKQLLPSEPSLRHDTNIRHGCRALILAAKNHGSPWFDNEETSRVGEEKMSQEKQRPHLVKRSRVEVWWIFWLFITCWVIYVRGFLTDNGAYLLAASNAQRGLQCAASRKPVVQIPSQLEWVFLFTNKHKHFKAFLIQVTSWAKPLQA